MKAKNLMESLRHDLKKGLDYDQVRSIKAMACNQLLLACDENRMAFFCQDDLMALLTLIALSEPITFQA
jgi:hypothetical protein